MSTNHSPAALAVKPETIIDLARQHRWRTRNLHDGHPIPPGRGPKHCERGSQAFRGERLDALVGRFGYIVLEGAGLGWFLVAATRPPHGKIVTIREAGGEVNQLGDREAAGTAPMSALKTLAKLIDVYRVVSDEVRLAASERGKTAFEKRGMPSEVGRIVKSTESCRFDPDASVDAALKAIAAGTSEADAYAGIVEAVGVSNHGMISRKRPVSC